MIHLLAYFGVAVAALLVTWIAIAVALWALWIQCGSRGLQACLLWPIWLPLWCLIRVYGRLSTVIKLLDSFIIHGWFLWARDFCVLAAHGGIDRDILVEDPAARMLSQMAAQMAVNHVTSGNQVNNTKH